MEIWLDTIDVEQIEKAKNLGLLDGVTTNPKILSESSDPAEEVLEQLLDRFAGPLAVQVTLRKASDMIEQGKDLYEFSPRIIVKIPVTPEGLQAIEQLTRLQIPVMATAIFEPLQAFLAAKAGARYLAPYFSLIGEKALPTCLSIQRMQLSAKLLIASLKTPEQVASCAEARFDAVTLKTPLFQECIAAPKQTLEHLDRFDAAWQSAPVSRLLVR